MPCPIRDHSGIFASNLYNKYYRSPSVLRYPGAGLGLYLARRIVAQHGGTISYVREADTVFRVVLPLGAEKAMEA